MRRTAFPEGTIVKYDGIPCRLLQDTPYYCATFSQRPENLTLQKIYDAIHDVFKVHYESEWTESKMHEVGQMG